MKTPQGTETPIEILPEQLSESAMAGIVENFILREGTDYGAAEVTYEKKAAQILRQIQTGEIKIVFDGESETVSLITAGDLRRLYAKIQMNKNE
jgi:uncharacterized protein YheU (UPF0270 family)